MPMLVSGPFKAQTELLTQHIPTCCQQTHLIIWARVSVWWDLTVLLSAQALLAFGSGNEVRIADGLADVEVLLFGWHSLGRRAGQWGASSLLYQALKTEGKISFKFWVNAPHSQIWFGTQCSCKCLICGNILSKHSAGWCLFYFCSRLNIEFRKSAGASNVGRCLSQDVSAVFSLTYFN